MPPALIRDLPLAELALAARFAVDLGPFLRHPVPEPQARAILRRRFERRADDFLALARATIYGHSESPYRTLLRLAGCEMGDLDRLVRQEGLDGALLALARDEVYLTNDELKGRRPAVRGSVTLQVRPEALWNPLLRGTVVARSSGSRGAATLVPDTVAYDRDVGIGTCLWLLARGGAAWRQAVWYVPGGAAVSTIVVLATLGNRPVRWFSQVDPRAPGLHPRYGWSARLLRWGSLAAGRQLPAPEYAPLDAPQPVLRWLRATLDAGQTPYVNTGVSAAVRVARAARARGVDLRGAHFTVGGEPVTAARLATIRAAGIDVRPWYAAIDGGPVGLGCLAPTAPDDMHLQDDMNAVVQPHADQTLYFTSLRPTARLILLNASLGDQAALEPSTCGCPLETLGWTTHLHHVRSGEKLTAAGMTFPDRDVLRVLDEVLPARFGGGPTDYQIAEEEAPDGQPRLRLLVHPALGELDADAVREAFLLALGASPGAPRLMAQVWRDADILRVERRPPEATFTGKILHLHQRPRADRPTA